ncbi:MAG: hypothetical protein JWL69_1294, partial [Phycisphaerales bacterium]|nr:hypothetical protein [Phycisphaerales bacterium]
MLQWVNWRRLATRVTLISLCGLVLPRSAICADAAGAEPHAEAAARWSRNLVADYGAGGTTGGEMSSVLQKAVDDAAAAGGGTIIIPARAGGWNLGRPVFVGSGNITLAGEGSGTRISGGNTLFILGCKQRYGDAISAGHFPPIDGEAGVLDKSVKDPRHGLRTFDGKTRASGFFPACPLAFGYKVLSDPSG